jgi:hypothetical protein
MKEINNGKVDVQDEMRFKEESNSRKGRLEGDDDRRNRGQERDHNGR